MTPNQLLFVFVAILAAGLIFVILWNVLFFNGLKKKVQAEYNARLSGFQEELALQLEEKLKLMQAQLREDNLRALTLIEDELRMANVYEAELLKAKLKNIQPSYPKKLEAAQKLAVLLNSLSSAPAPQFTDWKQQLQQYLLSYTGTIPTESEALVVSAIACTGAGDLEGLLQNLAQAKAGLKEGVSAGIKL